MKFRLKGISILIFQFLQVVRGAGNCKHNTGLLKDGPAEFDKVFKFLLEEGAYWDDNDFGGPGPTARKETGGPNLFAPNDPTNLPWFVKDYEAYKTKLTARTTPCKSYEEYGDFEEACKTECTKVNQANPDQCTGHEFLPRDGEN